MRGLLVRYRHELLTWALPAAIVVVGAVVTAATSIGAIAVGAAVLAGGVRVGLDIGRREQTADLERTLRTRAGAAVGLAAERLLERTLWHDEKVAAEARQRLVDRIVAERMGRPASADPVSPYPWINSWTLDDVAARGREAFDIRRHDAGDWLGVGAELRRARDEFRDSVAAFTPDLTAVTRTVITDCLDHLAAAKDAADRAFQVLYVPGEYADEAIAAASAALFTRIRAAHDSAAALIERHEH